MKKTLISGIIYLVFGAILFSVQNTWYLYLLAYIALTWGAWEIGRAINMLIPSFRRKGDLLVATRHDRNMLVYKQKMTNILIPFLTCFFVEFYVQETSSAIFWTGLSYIAMVAIYETYLLYRAYLIMKRRELKPKRGQDELEELEELHEEVYDLNQD